MNKKIISRVIEEASYIIDTNKTIREVSIVFGVSKSTVHKDMREKLLLLDSLYIKKCQVFWNIILILSILEGDRLQKISF